MKNIPIFKIGTHTATNGQSLTATAEFLSDVVRGYNPSNHEAPAVIGHPQDNHPAYGWVESLSFDEAKGVLYANFKQLEPQFSQMLNDGRFKKRSASFYPPEHPANPTKGKPYLRHVGFLGAQPPAVKGLADFSDDKDCLTYEFAEISTLTENDTMTEKHPDDPAQALDFAEREAELLAREAAIERREQAIEQERHQGFYDFTDDLTRTGKITPAERSPILSVLLDIDKSANTFDFSEDGICGQRSSADALKAVLNRLPPVIEFGELTASDPNTITLPQAVDDDSNDHLAQRIRQFADKNNLSFSEAVQQFNGAI